MRCGIDRASNAVRKQRLPDGLSNAEEIASYFDQTDRLKESVGRRSREPYGFDQQIVARVEMLRELMGYGTA